MNTIKKLDSLDYYERLHKTTNECALLFAFENEVEYKRGTKTTAAVDIDQQFRNFDYILL